MSERGDERSEEQRRSCLCSIVDSLLLARIRPSHRNPHLMLAVVMDVLISIRKHFMKMLVSGKPGSSVAFLGHDLRMEWPSGMSPHITL